MKNYITILFLFLSTIAFAQDEVITVPLGGNAYVSRNAGAQLHNKGIENWTDKNTEFKIYIRLAKQGTLIIGLNELDKVIGESQLSISVNQQAKQISLNAKKKINTLVGQWQITDTGYIAIAIKGLSKTSAQFPNIGSLFLSGSAINEKTVYVKNNDGNFFYWGRRGPSVHLSYQMPKNIDAAWFYNEVTVPKGEDIIGSYFMANGFGEGYFGMQVNSESERRILFSVWSPFSTDNPKEIPESHQIKMLKKGENVHTGEFGNEGAGGQSYLKYNWKAGNTYKFLLHGQPDADSTTTYTAYFFAPELNKWQLIASFKRPQTKTYLKRFHSFLENFIPEYGDITRKVFFGNQWIGDKNGNWIALKSATFTTDNTGNVGYRKDYAGGVDGNKFYLRNCGFFNDFTQPKTSFNRTGESKKPTVDFTNLP